MELKAHIIPAMVKDEQLVERRRQQIVDGAVQLFTKKGFHKTTTREIAKKCNMSIGTMYEYIQNKEDVLFLVCDHIHSKMENKLRRAISERDNGMDSLKNSFRQLLKVMDEMRPLVVLIYQETKSLPKAKMKFVLENEENMTSIFERILEKGIQDGTIQLDAVDVKLIAHNIMVIGQMWTFRYWSLGRHYTLHEYAEQQLALLLGQLD
jgi:TetR/AcrR family transcriptional regulator, cholesterol catabolism regulator